MNTALAEIGNQVRQGARTDQTVIDEAFRVWVNAGRSWKRTTEITGVAGTTLHLWAERDQWEQKRYDAAAAIAPGLQPDTAFTLQLSANRAAKIIDRMTADAEEHGTELNERTVKALLAIVDRGAVTAMTGKQQVGLEAGQRQENQEIPDFESMSLEEIREHEERVKTKRSVVYDNRARGTMAAASTPQPA